MSHPYRTRPDEQPQRQVNERRLDAATLGFSLLCALAGLVLAGADSPMYTLLATLVGAGALAMGTRSRGAR